MAILALFLQDRRDVFGKRRRVVGKLRAAPTQPEKAKQAPSANMRMPPSMIM